MKKIILSISAIGMLVVALVMFMLINVKLQFKNGDRLPPFS